MEEPSEGAAAMIACWQVDRINNLLHRQDRRIKLTNVQSTMLHTLLTAEGRLVSRGQLAAALPGGATLSSRAIDVYVWRLRRHLAQAGVDDLTVNTVVGRGYRVSQQEARSTDSIPINA
jgi:DNA-binding response OmpR family regulator